MGLREGDEVATECFEARDPATIIAEPLLIPEISLQVIGSALEAHFDSFWVHRAGLSSFSSRCVCQSSDKSFHPCSPQLDTSSSYCCSLDFVEVRMQGLHDDRESLEIGMTILAQKI